MPKEAVRTHVVIPRELVDLVDELVGQRGRSRFFSEAVEEKLSRVRLLRAAKRVVGSLADVDTPGWETSEAASEWVRASRRADGQRLRRRLEGK